ncbi:hypothetical protein GY45DRAFT_1017639 [Cubamyces sp. BRFM 1775]|nr:hypothetical protein GY45DRAFT_1017639 [Cubamyces sp. BRFM 1775]
MDGRFKLLVVYMFMRCLNDSFDSRPYPHLNDDILLEISSYLPLWKGLSPLSQSCKSIRELIKPLLFYAIHIDSACLLAPVIPEELPPPLIRPFARGMLRAPYFTLDYIDSPMDQVARSLTEFLNDLPLLHAITFKYTYSCGVPWKLLESMFSVPRLRSFQLLDRIPRDEPVPDDLWFSIAPKLEHFCYIDPRDYRAHPRYTAVEVALLLSVVTQASDSLRTLTMSAEAAPSLKVFSQLMWPHLRELRLKGERPQGWQAPIVPALAGLRALDTLVLEFALPLGTKPQLLWQEEIETALPWPALKTFSVTYPHPDDEIYSHLPSTLRTLALRCWPRHYIIREWSDISMEDTLRWHSPVLRASELLSICRRIQSDHMADLDIEYEQDQQEEELLHFLPYAYPKLTKLTLHRYRLPEEGDIDISPLAVEQPTYPSDLLRSQVGIVQGIRRLAHTVSPAQNARRTCGDPLSRTSVVTSFHLSPLEGRTRKQMDRVSRHHRLGQSARSL